MSPSTCTAKFSHFWAHGLSKVSDFHAQKVFGSGHNGLLLEKQVLRRLKFVVAAELPRRPFSLDFGFDLDSQVLLILVIFFWFKALSFHLVYNE